VCSQKEKETPLLPEAGRRGSDPSGAGYIGYFVTHFDLDVEYRTVETYWAAVKFRAHEVSVMG
jgi:hypothetical protein